MPMSPASAPPAVLLHDVAVAYDDTPIVRGVSLRVDRGEVVALVGPNGCGKTTLVRGVLGLAPVVAGELELFGTPAARFRERSRIGYVPQRHTVGGAIPSTVAEVVASGRLPRKRPFSRFTAADREAVRQAVETVGLGGQPRTEVATLSGGQQRRVLIARALASEPEMLVMDEPTAGVDATSQQSLAATLARLVEQGLTLLVVTHELAPLLPLVDRVVAMEHGRVVHDGPPEQALAAGLGGDHPGHDPAHSTVVDLSDPSGRGGAAPRWPGASRARR